MAKACSLAICKSCKMQLKALERCIRTAPKIKLLSRSGLPSSISAYMVGNEQKSTKIFANSLGLHIIAGDIKTKKVMLFGLRF